jgi:hypothetical protein
MELRAASGGPYARWLPGAEPVRSAGCNPGAAKTGDRAASTGSFRCSRPYQTSHRAGADDARRLPAARIAGDLLQQAYQILRTDMGAARTEPVQDGSARRRALP